MSKFPGLKTVQWKENYTYRYTAISSFYIFVCIYEDWLDLTFRYIKMSWSIIYDVAFWFSVQLYISMFYLIWFFQPRDKIEITCVWSHILLSNTSNRSGFINRYDLKLFSPTRITIVTDLKVLHVIICYNNVLTSSKPIFDF